MHKPELNRRDFLRTTSASVFAAGAVGALGGCSVGTFGSESSTGKGKGATVRFAMSGQATTADTADPALSNTQHDGRLMTAVYEQLTRYDEKLRAIPWLAESWSHNESATEWRFKLRKGVTFHAGKRLTAQDVVHSFRRILNPETGSAAAPLLTELDPDGIKAVDDRTVLFRLREPNGDLPLSLITKQSYIVPEGASSEDLRREAVGTGPFKLREFSPGGAKTTFVRYGKYWEPGLPKASTFQLVPIAESSTRVAGLLRGQVDIIENVPPTDLQRLRGGKTKVISQDKGDMEMIALQIDQPPFDDNRVRRALKHALNRERMVDLVTRGHAGMINDIPISADLQYGLQGTPRAHDVSKARELLRQAGHGDGLTVKLAVSDVQARFMDFATAYKAMATDADIDVQLDVSPADSYWEKVWLQVPAFVTAWIARPTESMLALLFLADSDSNETHWDRPDWEKRFKEARASLDQAQRVSMFRALQQEVVDEGGYLSPYMAATISAARREVTGWKQSGTFFEDFATIDLPA